MIYQDISLQQASVLLDYMYRGEVSVTEEELQGLLPVAECLQLKGLVEPLLPWAPSHKASEAEGTEGERSEAGLSLTPLDTEDMDSPAPPGPGMVRSIGPTGMIEWKRYKQYSKADILAAIEEVKQGETPQDSRLHLSWAREEGGGPTLST